MSTRTLLHSLRNRCLCGLLLVALLGIIPMMAIAQPNLALSATASHSGGGSGYPNGYGAQNYNDGLKPNGSYNGWVSASNSSGFNAWIQFDWGATPQSVGEITFFYVSTSTRYMQAGTVQYWDGANWVNHYNFNVGTPALTKIISFATVTTTKIRVSNFTIVGSQASNPNFHEIEVRNPIPPVDEFFVNPTSLYFQVEETGALPTPKNIALTTVPVTLAWTTILTQAPSPDWMAISPTTGTGATSVQTSILRSNLPAGIYNGMIGFRSLTAIPKDVPVQYEVFKRVKIAPQSDPAVVKFGCKGSFKVSKRVRIDNLGGHYGNGVMVWNATTGASEITLITASGTEGSDLVFEVNPVGLSEGSHTRTITITAWNSVSLINAENSPFTMNVKIEIEPGGNVVKTLSVGGSWTAFTNAIGQKATELLSNGGTVTTTVQMKPCQLPLGLYRLKYVKRSFIVTPNAAANLNARFYYTNTEASLGGVSNPAALTVWQQTVAGGAWTNRGGTSDPNSNLVEISGLTNFSGVFALAHNWVPKTISFDLAEARFDALTHNTILQWSTPLVTNGQGFFVERTASESPLDEDWQIVGKTECNATGEYGCIDRISDAGKYLYRIIGYDKDGVAFESQSISVEASFTVTDLTLEQNYPNPFSTSGGSTEISFSIPESGRASLVIFDNVGRIVREIVNQELLAGRHSFRFDAADLNAGQYFYRLSFGAKSITKAMTISK